MNFKPLLVLILTIATYNTFAANKIPQAVLEHHTAICPDFNGERGEYMAREVHLLPASEYSKNVKTLYLLGCEMYAYNSMAKAYLVDTYGKIENVIVAEVSADRSITATADLMGAGFDPETSTLGTFQKGRGIGDCGSAAIYQYDPMPEKFVLIEARIKNNCDGDNDSEWPVVYSK